MGLSAPSPAMHGQVQFGQLSQGLPIPQQQLAQNTHGANTHSVSDCVQDSK